MISSPTGKRRYTAPALEKGLAILELLASHPDGLTQAAIAREMGRSVGEIFRMVNVLEGRGYVRLCQPGDRYILSLKLYAFAHRHGQLRQLTTAAAGPMDSLARDLGQSCHLTVFGQSGVVVVAISQPSEGPSLTTRVGTTVPLLMASSGHLLLAFADDLSRRMMLEESYGKDECRRIMDECRVLWNDIRKRGYEERESYQIKGVTNISHPVFDFSGTCAASLNVPFLERLDRPDARNPGSIHPLVRAAAQVISAELGAPNRPDMATFGPMNEIVFS